MVSTQSFIGNYCRVFFFRIVSAFLDAVNLDLPVTQVDQDFLSRLKQYSNLSFRYLVFVAKTGSASFAWTKVKPLFRSKLENVIVDFSNVSPADEVPPVPNVDVFNFSGKDESQELKVWIF